MVHISKVYTRFGDAGETMLADGSRAKKSDVRIRAYGDVDELNALIGLVRLELTREPGHRQQVEFVAATDAQLSRIQQELFNLGAELATPGALPESTPVVLDRHVEQLEREIDDHNGPLAPLRSFVLPGGGPVGTASHVARTVCRRAERNLITLAAEQEVREEALRYLNRLSDYFFVLSRAAARAFGHDEVLWEPKKV